MYWKLAFASLFILFLATSVFAQNEQKPKRELGQPLLMALPRATPDKDPLTQFNENPNVRAAATAINQVLVERKLVILDLQQQVANFDKLRAQSSALQGDANAMIAANSGADVYLEFDIELIKEGPGSKANVNLNVKESGTALMLGSSSGQSDAMRTNDISSLCKIAVNNCIERVMQQIRGYWDELPTSGKPVMITLISKNTDLNRPTPTGKRIDRELTSFLKENTISYRRAFSTNRTLQFNPVKLDIYKFDDVEEFSYKIQDLFETFGLTYNATTEGKSIMIEID